MVNRRDIVQDELLQDLTRRLEPFGQSHVLATWDQLSPAEREELAREIRQLDLALVDYLYRQRDTVVDIHGLIEKAGSPRAVRLGADSTEQVSRREARNRGEEALRAGEMAVLLVAGGQGTRLGFPHPKGMFPIGPVSGHSLFQIHLEKILARSQKAGTAIPLAIMTSPATHRETVTFFEEHGRFGLPSEDFYVFCQGMMPSVDAETGRLLMASPSRLALSPDGHGGMLAAIVRSGTLKQLLDRGIRYLFYFQVDNPLVDILSPEAIGYHILLGSEMTTEVVAKETPYDRVGNVIQVEDRLFVVEYSDLPDDVAQRCGPDGRLLLWAGSIGVHIINIDFLLRMADLADALPYHIAYKKVAHYQPGQGYIDPQRPNAIKFERFIFDLIPHAQNAIVIEVDRQQHFAPLKNAPGAEADTPQHVQAQMVALHRSWLEANGLNVKEGIPVEISPLLALEADDLAGRFPAGYQVSEPTFFTREMKLSAPR